MRQPADRHEHRRNWSEREVADMKHNRPWFNLILPLAVGFLAIGFLAGCPWSPAPDNKPPLVVTNIVPQTSPANVLANLQTAYAERKIDEYRKLFAEDFIFVFNPADPVDPDHPNPAQWGLAEELSVTENMFADELVSKIELSSYSLGAAERVDSLYYGPRAWKVRVDQANLQVYTRKLDGTLLTLLVEGATEVFFFREEPTKPSPVDGRPTWYVIRWEDQPIGGKPRPTVAS
jgi:hypothetical protein